MTSRSQEHAATATDPPPAPAGPPAIQTFQLPRLFASTPERYELWTISIPASVNLADLDGCALQTWTSTKQEPGTPAPAAKSQGDELLDNEGTIVISSKSSLEHPLSWFQGHGYENEDMRLMVPHNKQQSNASMEEALENTKASRKKGKEETMKPMGPSYLPLVHEFERHISILEPFLTRIDDDSVHDGDEDNNPDAIKASLQVTGGTNGTLPVIQTYPSVPQKTNLKQRFLMPGSSFMENPDNRKRKKAKTSSRRKPSTPQSSRKRRHRDFANDYNEDDYDDTEEPDELAVMRNPNMDDENDKGSGEEMHSPGHSWKSSPASSPPSSSRHEKTSTPGSFVGVSSLSVAQVRDEMDVDKETLKEAKRDAKRAKKEAKREAKKAKKEAKKAKKEAKKEAKKLRKEQMQV